MAERSLWWRLRRHGGLLLGLLCIAWGPATGLARAIHLAQCDHHHVADGCPICVLLTIGSTADVAAPPLSINHANTTFLESFCLTAQVLAPADQRAPLAPRAPPPIS
ncbi:MAG: hypothetical protein KAY37_02640 [Phycisphaerae bacterium]|nr:hypothetical protein [Phycisphaerae bacterium]